RVLSPQCVSKQLCFCSLGFFRLVFSQPKTRPVVMRLAEIMVELQCSFVGPFGIFGLSCVVASQPKVIPGLRIRWQQRGGDAQFSYRLGVFSSFDQFFAVKQSTRTRRSAS